MKTLYIAIFSIAGVGLLIGGYFLYGYLTAKPEPTTTVDQPQQDQPIADQPAPVEATPAPEPEKPAPEPEKPAPTKETESLHVKGRDFVYKLHTHIDPNIKTLKEKRAVDRISNELRNLQPLRNLSRMTFKEVKGHFERVDQIIQLAYHLEHIAPTYRAPPGQNGFTVYKDGLHEICEHGELGGGDFQSTKSELPSDASSESTEYVDKLIKACGEYGSKLQIDGNKQEKLEIIVNSFTDLVMIHQVTGQTNRNVMEYLLLLLVFAEEGRSNYKRI